MIFKTLEKAYMYILFNHLMAWINDYHHPVSSFISEKKIDNYNSGFEEAAIVLHVNKKITYSFTIHSFNKR